VRARVDEPFAILPKRSSSTAEEAHDRDRRGSDRREARGARPPDRLRRAALELAQGSWLTVEPPGVGAGAGAGKRELLFSKLSLHRCGLSVPRSHAHVLVQLALRRVPRCGGLGSKQEVR